MKIFKWLKSVLKAIQTAGKVELLERLSSLSNEKEKLKKELTELKEQQKIKEQIEFKNDVYWKIKDKEKDIKEGPYCPNCYDSEKKLMHLLSSADPKHPYCPKCNLIISTEEGEVYYRGMDEEDEEF